MSPYDLRNASERLTPHAHDRMILEHRILAATPAALQDVASAIGVSKQRVHQREQALARRLDLAGLLGVLRFRVAARRRFNRVELEKVEATLLLQELEAHGFCVRRVAEYRLMPAALVLARIYALDLHDAVAAGRARHNGVKDEVLAERMRDRLALHGYSVGAAYGPDPGRVAHKYRELHRLGLVEWLVKERDRTGNQPIHGNPLHRSDPRSGRRRRRPTPQEST